jgi:hypothetical protein
MMPLPWAAASASQICRVIRTARPTARGPLLFDLVPEVAPFEKLQHHVHGAVGEATHVGHLHDVLVADGGSREGLAVKARHHLGVGRVLRVQALDRHTTLDENVLGLVHAPHAAFAELAHDAIAFLKHECRGWGLPRGRACRARRRRRAGGYRRSPRDGLSFSLDVQRAQKRKPPVSAAPPASGATPKEGICRRASAPPPASRTVIVLWLVLRASEMTVSTRVTPPVARMAGMKSTGPWRIVVGSVMTGCPMRCSTVRVPVETDPVR